MMWVIGGWLGWVIHGNWKIIYKGKIRLMFIGVLDGGYFFLGMFVHSKCSRNDTSPLFLGVGGVGTRASPKLLPKTYGVSKWGLKIGYPIPSTD